MPSNTDTEATEDVTAKGGCDCNALKPHIDNFAGLSIGRRRQQICQSYEAAGGVSSMRMTRVNHLAIDAISGCERLLTACACRDDISCTVADI